MVNQNNLVEIPGVGPSLVVKHADMGAFPLEINQNWLSAFLGTELPPAPNLQFVPWEQLDKDLRRSLKTKKGNPAAVVPFMRNYGAEFSDGVLTSITKPNIEKYVYGVVAEVGPSGTLTGMVAYDALIYIGGQESVMYFEDGGWKTIAASEATQYHYSRGFTWGSPGVVTVPVVFLDGMWHALMNLQHRLFLVDARNNLAGGQWTLNIAGGFGKQGVSSEAQALSELREEQGVIGYDEVVYLGSDHGDRARDITPVEYRLTRVSEVGAANLMADENLTIKDIRILVPLDCWRPGSDRVVNSAMDRAIRYLQVQTRYR